MAIILRPYQEQLKTNIYSAWDNGHKNVLAVLPTGGGKTKMFCTLAMEIVAEFHEPIAICVHRKELVQQISLTLAEEEITHNIIAQKSTIMGIVAAQRRVLHRQFYNYSAPITVVSVDTLNARILKHEKWAKSIRRWITDEAAHLLKANKWGRAIQYFPDARGLGVTATPRRLDKRGLGSHADGVFDVMVQGPTTRWLIDNGYLCNYKIAIPQSDYQRFLRKASDGSDYSHEAMAIASEQSQIVGDVVINYLKFAKGKQAILFASDTAAANKMEERFRSQGVIAKFLHADSGDKERLDSLLDYQQKKIQVLINIDLFDEGLDVPGIECVIMARPTMSLSKYLQMIGRGLRTAQGKPHLIVVDHVGNVTNHGLPCAIRKWTLDRIVKKRDKTNFVRICANIQCNAPYDRTLSACPWCGTAIERPGASGAGRPSPKEVDGDLELLDPETLRELEAKTKLADPAVIAHRVGNIHGAAAGVKAMKNQVARIETQKELSHVIAKIAGLWKREGYNDRQIHKRFYLEYEKTISESLAEPKAEMLHTMELLKGDYDI